MPSNRLIHEKSPYLLQHAHNPVDWFPWGEEAFAKARSENKPIFLSIGYSTCHWCHVMEHESFEVEKVAGVMNRLFVNIKVDREERPDVDQLYMTFVQATTGHGGWPMSVWLTPELKPFVGGTYFPPDDRYGRPGFVHMLEKIAEAWNSEPDKIRAHGDGVLQGLRQASFSSLSPDSALKEEWAKLTAARFIGSFDETNGGFGSAPKFPRPSVLNFLFRQAHHSNNKDGVEKACFTLRQMARGGMHDHAGGGFHRYSVDARWHVPHFEKMLYDQAQLLVSYLEAYQLTKDPFFSAVAEKTLAYCFRDLLSPEGGFYSAEDADSLPNAASTKKLEGAFYAWTYGGLEESLGEELLPVFEKTFEIEKNGNVPAAIDPHGELTGVNVLIFRRDADTSPRVEQALQKLFLKRAERPRPHLDDKIITAWNGLLLSALAKAWSVLRHEEALVRAEGLVVFIQKNLYQPGAGTLLRSYRQGPSTIPGFAEDYAFLIQGLLDLYEATGKESHLSWAWDLQQKQNELFLDPQEGGYFRSTAADTSILLRMKEDYDGAEPSSNSISSLNLIRLSDMLEDGKLREEASKILRQFSGHMEQSGTSVPQLQVALLAYLHQPSQIVLSGALKDPLLRQLQATLGETYLPDKLMLYVNTGEADSFLKEKLPALEKFETINQVPTAHVCRDFSCQLPVSTPEDLRKQLFTQT